MLHPPELAQPQHQYQDLELEIRRLGELNPDVYQKDFEDTLARIEAANTGRPRAVRAGKLWLDGKSSIWNKQSVTAQIARSDDNWLTEYAGAVTKIKQGNPGVLAEVESMIRVKQLGPRPLDKSKAAKLLATARTAQVEGELAILKQQGIAGDPDAFDEATKLVQRSGAVFDSEDTLAELRSIEMLQRFTDRKTKDLSAVRNLAVNEDFITQIMNKNLLPDEIQISPLPKTKVSLTEGTFISKRDWIDYAADSYEPAPTFTKPVGHNLVVKTVTDFNRKKISKEKAYKELLDSRYVLRQIKDEDFFWAVDKLNNPYTHQTATDIKAITESNTEAMRKQGFNFIFPEKDRERARDINTELIKWIDGKIKEEKTPDREAMVEKSAQLRANPPGKTPSQVASPKTKAEYKALPSGSLYLDPESGKLYRKK